MHLRRSHSHASPQRGVTLVIVLLILVIATILGIGGAQIALLGERSTRYDRDYLIASQSAESALMDAEFDIAGPNTFVGNRVAQFSPTNTGIFVADCGTSGLSVGLCEPAPETLKAVWLTVDFLDDDPATAHTVEYGRFTGGQFDAGGTGIKPARKPRYMVEVVDDRSPGGSAKFDPSKPPAKMYRITAMGFGPREDNQVVMQMTYRKDKE